MAKRGLFVGNIFPFLRDEGLRRGWALCVGAGISLPMFPDWNHLVERLISLDVGPDFAHDLAIELLNQYSSDAIIQAAKDRLKQTDNVFIETMSKELYGKIFEDLDKKEWSLFSKMLVALGGEYSYKDWEKYLKIYEKHYPELTASSIAQIITEILYTPICPQTILSFNVEPVLPSLITATNRIFPRKDNQNQFSQLFDLITHSVSNRNINRIPYYFIHGLLPIPNCKKGGRIPSSIDKLVFSESDYLKMLSSTYSWQSSVFLETISSKSVVFIGVSLSDPNMRRWLSLVHENRLNELNNKHGINGSSTSHYWINKRPNNVNEELWLESIVEYLGVRIVWVNEWSETSTALRKMLGLKY